MRRQRARGQFSNEQWKSAELHPSYIYSRSRKLILKDFRPTRRSPFCCFGDVCAVAECDKYNHSTHSLLKLRTVSTLKRLDIKQFEYSLALQYHHLGEGTFILVKQWKRKVTRGSAAIPPATHLMGVGRVVPLLLLSSTPRVYFLRVTHILQKYIVFL